MRHLILRTVGVTLIGYFLLLVNYPGSEPLGTLSTSYASPTVSTSTDTDSVLETETNEESTAAVSFLAESTLEVKTKGVPGSLAVVGNDLASAWIIYGPNGKVEKYLDSSGLAVVFPLTTPGDYEVTAVAFDGQRPIQREVTVKCEGQEPIPPQPVPQPGPNPAPQPTPEPEPSSKKWRVLFFIDSSELDELTLDQRVLVRGLTTKEMLEKEGHKFVGSLNWEDTVVNKSETVEVEKRVCDGYDRNGRQICRTVKSYETVTRQSVADDLKPWYTAAKERGPPCMVLSPLDGSKYVAFDLPASQEDMMELLEAAR